MIDAMHSAIKAANNHSGLSNTQAQSLSEKEILHNGNDGDADDADEPQIPCEENLIHTSIYFGGRKSYSNLPRKQYNEGHTNERKQNKPKYAGGRSQ